MIPAGAFPPWAFHVPPHLSRTPPRRYIVCGKNKNVKATCANDARGNVGFGNAGKNVSWEGVAGRVPGFRAALRHCSPAGWPMCCAAPLLTSPPFSALLQNIGNYNAGDGNVGDHNDGGLAQEQQAERRMHFLPALCMQPRLWMCSVLAA